MKVASGISLSIPITPKHPHIITQRENTQFRQPNIMCHVIYHTHNKCKHDKKVEIIASCGNIEEGTCIHVPILYVFINSPSLCVSCFREEEAKIDAVYNEIAERIRGRIAEREAVVAAHPDRRIQVRTMGIVDLHVKRLEYALAKEKELRDEKIQAFRNEQGVWGDG